MYDRRLQDVCLWSPGDETPNWVLQAMICTKFVKRLALQQLSLPSTCDSYLYTGLESAAAVAALVILAAAPSLEQWSKAGHALFWERHQELSACHNVWGPANLWGRQASREMHGH